MKGGVWGGGGEEVRTWQPSRGPVLQCQDAHSRDSTRCMRNRKNLVNS